MAYYGIDLAGYELHSADDWRPAALAHRAIALESVT
jgi:hypothetical protein